MTQTNLFPADVVPSFLEEVWNEIANSNSDPSKTYIILPSVRAGVFYKNLYRTKAMQSMLLPNITTLHSFIDQFSPVKTIDSNTALFELYICYRNLFLENAESFPDFYKWARLLLNDFNEIDNYLIDAAHLYRNLCDLKELEDWSFNDGDLSKTQEKFVHFWDKLLPLYRAFENHLYTLGKAYSGKKVRWFANNIDQFIDNNTGLNLYFIGFNALNRAEETIIDSLGSAGLATVFWDVDPYYHQNPDQEAGKFFPQKGRLAYYRFIEGKMKTHAQSIDVMGVPKNVGQVKTAAKLLGKIKETDHKNTAVILANEALLLPFLNSIPENIQSVNLTMGIPLRTNPLYTLLENLFEFQTSIGSGSVPVALIRNITEHQFLRTHFSRNQELNELLEKRRFINKEQLLACLSDKLELVLFSPWKDQVELAIQNIQFALNELKDLYEKLKLSPLEKEFLFQAGKCLNQFKQSTSPYQELVDLSVFKRLFFDALKTQKTTIKGDPINGLQVMGMLETRALDFKNLIVLGANEGIMPASPSDSSLIPGDLKRHYGLPTHEKREAIYAYYVYRLLHRSEQVSFIYNNVVDDLGGSEKSRFLLQLKEELPRVNPKISFNEWQVAGDVKTDGTSPISVLKSPDILAKIKGQLAAGISPTALSTFIECPLNFYYKYVIGLSEAGSRDEVSASEFGSLVHRIIELAFEGMEGKILDPPFYSKAIKEIDLLAAQALKDTLNSTNPEGKTLISLELAKYQFKRLMELEGDLVKKLQAERKTTKFIAAEKTMSAEFQFEIDSERIDVKVKGKIDRIHQTDNTIWVIDYKTGKVNEKDLQINALSELADSEKRKALQLALYGMALQKEYSGLALKTGIVSTVSPSEEPFTLSLNKEALSFDAVTAQAIQEVVINILKDLLDKDLPLEHKPSSLYCPYC